MNYHSREQATSATSHFMSAIALPEPLKLRVEESVASMFQPPISRELSFEEQLASGAFSSEVEFIRKPMMTLDRREGGLIEAAIRFALLNSPHFVARASVPTEIYKGAFDIVDANGFSDACLDVRLKLSGPAVDRIALDVIAIDRETNAVKLVEIKRSELGISDTQIRTLRAAAFTIRERLIDQAGAARSIIASLRSDPVR